MPQIQGDNLDVTAEEERYLRRSFRRFALPYLILGIVLVGLLALAGGMVSTGSGGGAPTDEMNSIVAEAAALREAIGSMRDEFRQQDVAAAERLESLEGGVTKLRESMEGESAAELGSRLDHAHQRINALEGRLAELETAPPTASSVPPASPAPAWRPADSNLR